MLARFAYAVTHGLFSSRPNSHVVTLANLDVDDVRATAYRAVLDVFLRCPSREVDGHDDFLATRIANVTGFVVHDVVPDSGGFGAITFTSIELYWANNRRPREKAGVTAGTRTCRRFAA